MRALTRSQRAALVVLGTGGEHGPVQLAVALGTSREGAGQTAASLIRRGLAERTGQRPVTYRITTKGLDHLEVEQLELTP